MFTEKQLADLEFLFSKNPYPAPSLQKEMASKLEIHPTVLQVGKLKPHLARPPPQKTLRSETLGQFLKLHTTPVPKTPKT